ncbi:Ankyrin repeats (3 copies) [compost metagenome]
MMYALSNGHYEVAHSLVTDNTSIHQGKLMLASHYGVDRIITQLLEEHANILELSPAGPGWFPMMLAAQGNEDSHAVEILMEAAIAQLIGVPDIAM